MIPYLIFEAIIILFFSVLLSVQDIKNREISNVKLISAIVVAACCQLIFVFNVSWLFFISAGIFGLLYFLIKLITKGKLGNADIYFGIFQGFFIEPKFIWVCLAVESACAALYALIKLRIKKANFENSTKEIPFIPFMALGLITVFCIELLMIGRS